MVSLKDLKDPSIKVYRKDRGGKVIGYGPQHVCRYTTQSDD